jgi:biopolymer transport protein ExbB/TolQ
MREALATDAALRQAIAGSDPATLPWNVRFWRRQVALTLVILGSGGALGYLGAYTYDPEGHVVIVLAAQLLGVWAVVLAVRTLARLDVDTAVVCEIESRGARYLADLRAGNRAYIDIDRLEQEMVPLNPAEPPLASIRLFQQICNEARERRFDSGVDVVQPYREEAVDDLFRLQNVQKVALWIGILGTFVGLLQTLRHVSFEGARTLDQLMPLVVGMIGGMKSAFTASVAGLEAAVVVSCVLMIVRRRQERYFAHVETAVAVMLAMARRTHNPDDVLTELSSVSSVVRDLTARVYEQTTDVGLRLGALHKRMEEQNASIGAGMAALTQSVPQLKSFLDSLEAAQRAFIDDVKGLYDVLALRELGRTLNEGVATAGKQVVDRYVEATGVATSQILGLNTSIDALTQSIRQQGAQHAEHIKGLGAALTSSTQKQAEAVLTVGLQIQKDNARHSGGTQYIGSHIEELSKRIAKMTETMERGGMLPAKRRSLGDYLPFMRESGKVAK